MFPLDYGKFGDEADRLRVVAKRRNEGPGLVGRNLRRLRDARGWNQQELADAAGVDRVTISKIETGAQADVSVDAMVVPLARALGVRPEALVEVPKETAPNERLIREFNESPWGQVVKPTQEEIDWLRSIPDTFWFGIKPSPAVLARIIEAHREGSRA